MAPSSSPVVTGASTESTQVTVRCSCSSSRSLGSTASAVEAGRTATVDTSLLRATGTSQISSFSSSTVRSAKLSKPQSNSRAVSEKLSTRVPPVSVLTSSQPSTTLMRVRLPRMAEDTRQWPAASVVPVLMPCAPE